LGGFAEAVAQYNKVDDNASGVNANKAANHATNMDGTNRSEDASQILLPRVELNVIADMNSWTTAYLSFVTRTVSSNQTNNVELNDAYVLLGNLNKTPFYGFLGRNTLDFGSFKNVNFATPSLNRLEFEAFGNEIGFGFDEYGFNGSLAAVNGYGLSSQTGSNNQYNVYTKDTDGVDNFVANVGYGMKTAGANWHVGAGYIDGSKQRDSVNRESVGAWDINGNLDVANFDLLAEYTSTTSEPKNSGGERLKAWDIGGSYHFPLMGKTTKVNLDYSAVSATYDAKEWVLGIQQQTFKNVWMGVEYSSAKGQLSGAADAAVANNSVYGQFTNTYGVPTSNENVENNTLLFDVQGAF
jgi:hypothetical protein